MSSLVLSLTGTALSQNPGILISRGNPSSCVRALITLGFLPPWTIPSKVSRLSVEITLHLPCLTKCPILALVLITSDSSWISSRNKSLLLLSWVGRRWIFLPLSTSTHILDASHNTYLSLCGHSRPDPRVHSSSNHWRMMCF